MPIYDYSCTACKHLVEVIHGINDAGPRFCPNCGAEGTMRKGFSTPAVHFKGSGWAKKDRSATSSPGKSSSAKAPAPSSDAAEAAPAKSETPTPAPASDGGD